MTATNVLDAAFQALSNPTRRSVIEKLGSGPATVSELADPFDMALPSFMQHLKVLEDSGLVHSVKKGRVRTVHIRADNLRQVASWLDGQRDLWDQRLDRLDALLRKSKDERGDGSP